MRLSVWFAVVGFLVGCAGEAGSPRPVVLEPGTLRYLAFNGGVTPLLEGSLSLEVGEDSLITGSWAIDWVAGADTTVTVGPQVGAGVLAGQLLADGSVVLNLNVDYADHNVFLYGRRTGDRISGTWEYSGFAGPMAWGRFAAW